MNTERTMDDRRIRVEVEASGPAEATLRLHGDIDIFADEALAAGYVRATEDGAARLVLDFGGIGYINSTGIALIVRLLAEARRDRREVVAVGLSDHYREIFRITRLSDYLTIVDDAGTTGALEEATR
jgi:anti-sigma B factor antagonist